MCIHLFKTRFKMNPKILYQYQRRNRIRGIELYWLVSQNITKITLNSNNNPYYCIVFQGLD